MPKQNLNFYERLAADSIEMERHRNSIILSSLDKIKWYFLDFNTFGTIGILGTLLFGTFIGIVLGVSVERLNVDLAIQDCQTRAPAGKVCAVATVFVDAK